MKRWTSALTTVLLVAGLTVVGVVAAPSAGAAAIPFATFFSTQDNGAISLIGNSQMTCPDSAASCASARNAAATSAAQSGVNNNDYAMGFIDADSDSSTTNSTSADLALPSGSTVLSALLVWGGRRANSSGTIAVTTAQAQVVKFKAPGASSYSSLTGTLDDPNQSSDFPYQGYIDVTNDVKAAGNGTYWVGDIAAGTGADRYAGWSLIVAYRNPSAPLRDLRIYHGFNTVSGSSTVTIPITGFLTPTSGTVSSAIGVVAGEGDRGFVGDGLQFGGQLAADGVTPATTGTTLSDATRPATNFFNSAISDSGTPLTARTPAYSNNFGYDIGRINATNILANGQTSTYIKLTTNGDTYYPNVVTTQIDLFTPAFNPNPKSVVDLSGNSPAKIGDTLRYQVSLTNTGSDPADSSVLTDALPANVTYVPGSLVLVANPGSAANLGLSDDTGDDLGEYLPASRTVQVRVGQGASATAGGTIGVNQTVTVQFQVTVDRAAAGTTVSNTPDLAYVAHTIGKAFTFVGNQVDTPVAQVADLALTKTGSPATQTAGSNVTYTLAVKNNGPDAASNVVLSDTLPTGVGFVSAAPPSGTTCAASGQVVTCTTASLANGATITVPITTTIAPATASGSALTDVATVTSDTGDDVPGNNTANVTTQSTAAADVSLTAAAAPTSVNAGSTVTYTLTARNAGPSTAANVVITDGLPLGLNYVSSTPNAVCTNASGTLTCAVGSLAPNASTAVTITAQVSSNVQPGTITNGATVASSTPDPNNANNSASTPITVTANADLSLAETSSVSTLVAGSPVTYTLTVTNKGPSDAAGVTLSDPAVAGLTLISAASSQGTCAIAANAANCTIGTVTSGGTVTVTLQARVPSGTPAGTVTNGATVSSTTPDPTSADNSASAPVTVTTSADLGLTNTGSPATIVPGQPVTYTLTATNGGPSAASGVTITDTLPSSLTFTGGSPGCTAAGQVVTCVVGSLANAATASVTITAQASAGATGTITNTGTVSATTSDPNPANNSAAAVSSTSPLADVSITTSTARPVTAGSTVTYTLVAQNNGPSVASTVEIDDTLPSGITIQSITAPAGFDCTTSTTTKLVCTSTSLAVGASATLTMVGKVPSTAIGSSTDTATITTATTDPTPGNNTSSSTVTIAASADVAVSLTAPSTPFTAGSTVTYSLQATNNGPSTARNVVITGQVPPGMVPVIGSSGGACVYTAGTGTVTCAIGDLPPGASTAVIPLRAVIDPSQAAGTIPGTAVVGSDTPDPTPGNNSSTANVTVTTAANLSITNTVSPSPLVAGSPATYTLTVANAGPSDAQTVQVVDDLPAGVTVVSANPSLGSCTVTGQHVVCTIPTVQANSSMTISLVTQIGSSASGSLADTATVSAATTDPDTSNNAATATATVNRTAHLTLSKTAGPDPVVAGAAVTYTLSLVNNGPSDATAVTLSDPLPDGTTILPNGVTSTGGVCPQQNNATSFSCDFGTVEAGGTRTVQISALPDPGLAPGSSLANTATVASPTPDSDPAGRTATVTSAVVTAADLSVTEQPVTDPVEAGGLQTYVLQITNNGPSVSRGVVVTDPLPAGVTLVSVVPSTGCTTGATVTCSLGDLAPSQTATIQVTVRLDSNIGGTRLTNTASVASAPDTGTATPDPDTTNNTSSASQLVATRSDLSLTKSITSGPIVAGATVTYRLVATNNGPSDTTNLRISDPLPAGTTLVDAVASNGGSCQLVNPVTCSFPSVAAGATRIVTLTIGVPATATVGSVLTNTAGATSDNVDTTPAAALATSSGPVTAAANVSVTKTLLSGNPVAGGSATWQMVVHNAGPSQAVNVVLDDTAPDGVQFTSTTPAASCAIVAAQLHCALGALSSAASVTVTVTGTLSADYAGDTVTNAATVGSDTPDPTPGDNTSSTTADTTTSANLAVTNQATTSPFVAGQPAAWTLTVSNAGPSTAAGVVVTDVLPAGLTAATASVVGGAACTVAPGTGAATGSLVVTCPVGTVAVGSPVQIAVSGTLAASVVAPAVLATAQVTATTPDPDPTDNTSTVSTPVGTTADVSLTSSAPAGVHAGEVVTWTLTAHNDGPSDAQGVTVTDTLPAGLTGVTGTGPGGACSVSGSTLTCGIGTLAAGADAVVTISGTTDPLAVDTLHNAATATATTADPNPDNNATVSDTTVTRLAGVSVTNSFNGTSAVPGSTVSWTVVASNAGPSTATGVVLTDTLPAGVTGITATFGPTHTACTVTGQDVSCPLDTLAQGVPVDVVITGTLAPSYTAATLDDTATIASPDDNTPADNSATSSTPVAPSADLAIGNALTSGPPIAGAAGQYVLTVTNAGPSDAVNVVVTDTLPADFVGATATLSGATGSCSIANGTLTCTIASVPAGSTPAVTIDGQFTQDLTSPVVNTATVAADTPDPAPANNTSTSTGSLGQSADLQVGVTGPATVVAGTAITWTVTVHNAGPSDAQAVTLTDTVPDGVGGATATVTGGGPCDPSACGLGTIPAGATVTVTVSGTLSPSYAATSVADQVSAAGSTPDPDGGNNQAATSTEVTTAARLTVAKVATPDPLIPGQGATYTITVANAGPSDAQGAVVTDPLPDGLVIRGAGPTASQGDCDLLGRTVSCALGVLAAGTSATITVPVTVDAGFAGSAVTNTATIGSATPDTDPDPAARTGSVTTEVTPQADLTLTKSGPTAIVAGQGLSWVISLTNSGPSVARDVVITDPVPVAVTGLAATSTQGACSITGQTVRCDVGLLAAGDSARITLFVTGAVDPTFTGAAIDNTATVASSTPEPGPDPTAGRSATAHTEVSQQADLQVVAVPSAAAFTAGSPASWLVTVTNQGLSTATGVSLTDVVPAGLGSPVFTGPDNQPLSCPGGVCALGTLAPGESVSIRVSGTIDPAYTGSSITDGASVVSPVPDPVPGNNTVTSRVPVGTLAHLVVAKTGPATAVAGQALQWTIAVSNTGPSTARGVQVSDPLPAGITGITVVGQTGVTCSAAPAAGATLTCSLPDLAPGDAPVTVTVAATLDAGYSGGSIANTASASTTTTQSNPGSGDDSSTVTTTVGTQADLSVTTTGPTGAVTAGRTITWTVVVRNAGPSVARTVTVDDPAPAGVTGLTGTWTGGTCDTPCALGDLAPSGTVTITYTGTVSAGYTGDSVSDTATVSSPTSDPNAANNSSTATTEIVRSADVSLTKTVSPSPVVPGRTVTYTLAVHNAGPSDAAGVAVSDSLPASLTDVSATTTRGTCALAAGVLSCPVGALPSGGDATVTITATLAADVDPGTVSNTASVTATTPDPDLSNNSSTASATTALANLAVTKTASAASVRPGGTLSWTVTTTNNGTGPARGTVVTDQLPAGVGLGTATPSQGTCTSTSGGLVTCQLGTVAPGDAATVVITGTVSGSQTADLTNAATATSPDEADPTDNTAQVTTPVQAVANLSLTKVVTSGDVVAGQPVSWQLAVHNAGPAAAPNVVVTDPLPDGVGTVTASTGCTVGNGTVRCVVGTLASGGDATVTINGTVDPALRGTLTNTATVASDVPDPDPSDNTATASSPVSLDTNVTVTKTADRSVVLAGGTVTYRIQAIQNGASTSDPVTVKENIPLGSTVTDFNPSQGTFDSATTTWSVGQVAPGATATLLVTLQLGSEGDAVNTVVGAVEGVTKTITAQATVKVTPKAPNNGGGGGGGSGNGGSGGGGSGGGELPNTGFAALRFSTVGLALLLAGALLLLLASRRRRFE